MFNLTDEVARIIEAAMLNVVEGGQGYIAMSRTAAVSIQELYESYKKLEGF